MSLTITLEIDWNNASSEVKKHICMYANLSEDDVRHLWASMTCSQQMWCCTYQKLSQAFVEERWDDIYYASDKHFCIRKGKVSKKFLMDNWSSLREYVRLYCLTHLTLPKEFIFQRWDGLKPDVQVKCWRGQKLIHRLREQELPMFLVSGNDAVRKSANWLMRRLKAKKRRESKWR